MVEREDIHSIFYALHSLDAPASVDTFKFRMGYRAKPVRQRVCFHPLLQPFAGQFPHIVIGRLRDQFKTNRLLAKAEGMLRFYHQGLRPLEEQDWPENLGNREQLLAQFRSRNSEN